MQSVEDIIEEGAKRTRARRAFQLTLNQVDKWGEVLGYLDELKQRDYIIACREFAPTTGHEHIHCYVHFKNAFRLTIGRLCGAHIVYCNGTPQDNIAYITKLGAEIILEKGTRPHKGGYTIKEIAEMPADKQAELPVMYYNVIEKIKTKAAATIKLDDWHKTVDVTYISGPSGIGKSHKAYELLKSEGYDSVNIVKYENGFWHNVTDDCPCCIYDDFRDGHMKPSEFINFIDYNIHALNVKGGSVQNRYKRIIITSVQDLDDIYPNVSSEPREQWTRRIKHIKMEKV